MRKGIVFDLDDTLYKENEYRLSGFRTVSRHYAAACGISPEEAYSLMAANPDEAFETLIHLAAARGIEITVNDILQIYRTHLPDISLPAETVNVLTLLRKRGYMLGLITDGRVFGQLNKIAALDIKRYMDPRFIIPTVMLDTDKHHSKPFTEMMSLMGEDVAMTYVGDNPAKDFHHPNLSGWRTIMLRDTTGVNVHRQNTEDYPVEFRPQTEITSLSQLLDIYN
ncbi:MAG: HAD hydrolase-like protein [Bacteroidales bacterium]|nr:HAD hydrolase-like protein [Bacteroidales bacterium]